MKLVSVNWDIWDPVSYSRLIKLKIEVGKTIDTNNFSYAFYILFQH